MSTASGARRGCRRSAPSSRVERELRGGREGRSGAHRVHALPEERHGGVRRVAHQQDARVGAQRRALHRASERSIDPTDEQTHAYSMLRVLNGNASRVLEAERLIVSIGNGMVRRSRTFTHARGCGSIAKYCRTSSSLQVQVQVQVQVALKVALLCHGIALPSYTIPISDADSMLYVLY